ncbi:MAG: hypothetical protein AAF938_06650 [Myxococcota bacterium]
MRVPEVSTVCSHERVENQRRFRERDLMVRYFSGEVEVCGRRAHDRPDILAAADGSLDDHVCFVGRCDGPAEAFKGRHGHLSSDLDELGRKSHAFEAWNFRARYECDGPRLRNGHIRIGERFERGATGSAAACGE